MRVCKKVSSSFPICVSLSPVTLSLDTKTLMLNLVNHLQTKLRSICQKFLNTMTIDRLLVKMYFVTIFVTILFCCCVLILLLLYFVILIKKITKQARWHPEFQTCPIKFYLSD